MIEQPIEHELDLSGSFRGVRPNLDEQDLALFTDRLSIGFESKPVLEEVSLSFPRGSITALIGPSGSGKTTYLRTLNRMNDHVRQYFRTGDVLLDGLSIFGPRIDLLALRRRVGMLFQRPNPFPMSIIDNVLVGARAHRIVHRKQEKDLAQALLEEVGLWKAVSNRLGDSPFRLSGGQQQLLCLARALAVGPEVLLLDEPTSSLDPISIEAVESLIARLSPRISFIVVTHNLAQAKRLSHYTAFFYQGKLVEHNVTSEVFSNPSAPETQRYVSGSMG